MADPDCGLCAMAGYRACDFCGGVVFKRRPLGADICDYCAPVVAQTEGAEPIRRASDGSGGGPGSA